MNTHAIRAVYKLCSYDGSCRTQSHYYSRASRLAYAYIKIDSLLLADEMRVRLVARDGVGHREKQRRRIKEMLTWLVPHAAYCPVQKYT